jgi:hypothetical protein
MSRFSRVFATGFLLFLAGYTMLAQPGIPSCWLEKRTCEAHPHFNKHHAETPHSHDYLFELVQSLDAPDLSSILIPVSLLIAALFSIKIFRDLASSVLIGMVWFFSIDPPPPRRLLSL